MTEIKIYSNQDPSKLKFFLVDSEKEADIVLKDGKLQENSSNQKETAEDDASKDAKRFLKQLGIPAHLLGYKHILIAIELLKKDHSVINNITTRLYPSIAKTVNERGHGKEYTTPSRVERSIRHAIEVGFDQSDPEYLEKIFGYSIDYRKGKPTNAQFLATIYEYL